MITPKSLGRASFVFFTFLFISPQLGYCAEQDPAIFLTDFYTWYIPAQSQMRPEYHSNIYTYVARETVEEIKKISDMPGHDRTDYFIKLSNTPSDMNGVSILVHQVETIGPDTLVATVTIVHTAKDGYRFPDGVVIVILKQTDGHLKIFKCIDAYPEA